MQKLIVLGSKISVVSMTYLIEEIEKFIEEKKTHYICVSNVHTVITGYQEKQYREINNNSLFSIPDGMPLCILGKLKGFKNIERCTGPDLMTEIFKLSELKNYSHFFYGNTLENLLLLKKKLMEKYPNINIAGFHSPPFRELTERETKQIVGHINSVKPDIIWVGLGAPKQEIWMWENKENINGSLMIGVGAAFNFHTDLIKRAPPLMQKLSMEWVYRLIQEPKRLFLRYARTNSLFILLLLKEKAIQILRRGKV